MAMLRHPNGRTVTVPDATVDYYTANGWALAGAQPDEKRKVSAKKSVKGAAHAVDAGESVTVHADADGGAAS